MGSKTLTVRLTSDHLARPPPQITNLWHAYPTQITSVTKYSYFQALNPQPSTLNPETSTLNPQQFLFASPNTWTVSCQLQRIAPSTDHKITRFGAVASFARAYTAPRRPCLGRVSIREDCTVRNIDYPTTWMWSIRCVTSKGAPRGKQTQTRHNLDPKP
jgi:hypothetical protein